MHISDVLYVFYVGWMIYLYHTECRDVGDAKIFWSFCIPCLILINSSLFPLFCVFLLDIWGS